MLVAKCSACKKKTELQACEVCEEAKCVKCAQYHRTELTNKWKTIETRVVNIKQKTKTRQHLLILIQQNTERQLLQLKQEYDKILVKLKKEYEEYQKQLSTSKTDYNNKLAELERRWQELQTNELFKKWTTITDESRYLLAEDSSLIENLVTKFESYLAEMNDSELNECTFSPSTDVSLGALTPIYRTNQIDVSRNTLSTTLSPSKVQKAKQTLYFYPGQSLNVTNDSKVTRQSRTEPKSLSSSVDRQNK